MVRLMDIEEIRYLYHSGKVHWTEHILNKMDQRNISAREVADAIDQGKIIEQYPNPVEEPSCLLCHKNITQKIHIVVTKKEGVLLLVTAYVPDLGHFQEDLKTRRRK